MKKKEGAIAVMKTRQIIACGLLMAMLGGTLPLVVPAAAASDPEVYTPPPGSAERKAMLDLLREWIKKHHYVDVIFVVWHLKVQDGYAWVNAMPRSKDGASGYEDISALLKKDKGFWKIAEIPCGEEDNPDCIGAPGYFDGLKKRFPEMPEDILPL